MTFLEYLKSKNKTFLEAGNELGLSEMQIRRLAKGDSRPQPDNMETIFNWSNGEVTPNDWYNLGNNNPVQESTEPSEV